MFDCDALAFFTGLQRLDQHQFLKLDAWHGCLMQLFMAA